MYCKLLFIIYRMFIGSKFEVKHIKLSFLQASTKYLSLLFVHSKKETFRLLQTK